MSDQPGYTYPNQPQPPQYAGQYQQGAYLNYSQMYGQQLPEHMEKPVAPKSLKIGALVLYCMAALSVLSEILGIFFYNDIQAEMEETLTAFLGLSDFSSSAEATTQLEGELMTVSLIIGMVFSLIWNGAAATMAFFMVKGHNWARVVATIYASLSALGLVSVFSWLIVFHWSMLVGFLVSVLAVIALVFFWQRPSSEYMQQSRIYKQWVQRQSYMAPRA